MKKKKGAFEKRLKAYSAVAAGTLLLAPSANAVVVYSGPQNLPFTQGGPAVNVDLNNDGVNDFVFNGSTSSTFSYSSARIFIGLATSGGIGGQSCIFAYADNPANLPSNYLIQNNLNPPYSWSSYSTGTLAKTAWTYYSYNSSTTFTDGNFIGRSGYIGVRFDSAVCTHYGWIQYDGTNSPATSGNIVDWAYEDTCNASIRAGATVGAPAIPAPTLNQWGLLVLITLLAGAGAGVIRKQQKA